MAPVVHEILFGPFRLQPDRQLLLEGERPVRIGSRALRILIALVERAGDVVTKDDLVSHVWPDRTVDDGNLRAQIASLRRALRDGSPGARYVVAVPGRGYCFVAPISSSVEAGAVTPPARPTQSARYLPHPLSRVIGRDDSVSTIIRRLERDRFLTIVGPGGIGKTTVALVVAHETSGSYTDGACFIDLAPVSGSLTISSVVASALGLAVVSEDPTAEVVAFLRDRRLLLILDSCEHVLEAVAVLAESVYAGTSHAHILATSREPLRAGGESILRLAPLATPPESIELTATEALGFSAVELFAERAAACLEQFQLTDENVPAISGICRKLDGMALAIELAAGRIGTFGVHGLAAQLDDRFRLIMQGRRRTALPRHRTLGAALDWSYEFLNDIERAVLRRLSVFVGGFTLEAAEAVAGDPDEKPPVVVVVGDLAQKSLVSVNTAGSPPTYRLLDTTRAYAIEKLTQSGEADRTSRRHAEYYHGLLERAGAEAEAKPLDEWRAAYGRQVDNVRKALDWAFSPQGDPTLGLSLTLISLPLWMHFSLMEECRSRVAQALSRLPPAPDRNPRIEMQLCHALGAVLLNIEASGSEMESALRNALEIADALDETDYRLRVIWCLWCHAHNIGDFREAMALADRFCEVAKRSPDPVDPLTGERMRGFVLHFLGDQASARRLIEYMLNNYVAPVHRAHIIRFQFDQLITARNFLVQVLWLQGFVDQALSMNAANVAEASAFDHTMTLCNALTKCACRVTLMAHDLPAARRYIDMLLTRSARDGLPMWHAWGKCFKAILMIKEGAVDEGLALLQTTLHALPQNRFSLRYIWVLGEYASGLHVSNRITEGLSVIDEALGLSERDNELWWLSELLRIKGELTLAKGGATAERDAERFLLRAFDVASQQKVLSLELRAAVGLAKLYRDEGRLTEARHRLTAVYGRFSEGFASEDLRQAKRIIDATS